MAGLERVWWIVVECSCRILGVATATVLCAVGVETLRQGEFHSLAIYLLVSAAGIALFELAYFLDVLLVMCLPLPPAWLVFVLWRKLARLGGFQKFLYCSIMSVVCFLHPVLVWHAVIPGTMLLVTAFFNLILSKKPKTTPPKGPQEAGLTGVRVEGRAQGSGRRTLSVFHVALGGRRGGGGLTFSPSGGGERGESAQAMLEGAEPGRRGGSAEREGRRGRRGKGERRRLGGGRGEEEEEREMEEMEEFGQSEPETNSDTAPMITD